MKLFWLVALTMTAFAFNSVLNRLALASGDTGPASYAAIRLISGALILGALVYFRKRPIPRPDAHSVWSAAMLLLYALGFSYAYITLPTGVGALILFGGVQVVSFAISLVRKHHIGALTWAGAGIAFSGLCFLLWPDGDTQIDGLGAALMIAAAVGWAFYTVAGKQGDDPLGATALAFLYAAPFAAGVWIFTPDAATPLGIFWAVVSGVVTSGLGYALWYRVLPELSVPTASVAQLTVPVIAALGGALILSEALTLRFTLATCVVLCGIGMTILGQGRKK